VTDESEGHDMKQFEPMISTFRGIVTDSNDVNANALASIRSNCEESPNEIEQSWLQREKHFKPRVSTLGGIAIDFRAQSEKARDSIRLNKEPDPKETLESSPQPAKQHSPMVSTTGWHSWVLRCDIG
jgi:hypothetical protein